jgi:hypothetical protein
MSQDPDHLKPVASAQIVMTHHEGELRRLIPDAFTQTTCRITFARIAAHPRSASSAMTCFALAITDRPVGAIRRPSLRKLSILASGRGFPVAKYSKHFWQVEHIGTHRKIGTTALDFGGCSAVHFKLC